MPQRDLDSSPTATRFERLIITAHGSQTARRLAWRFAETGLVIKSCDFTEAALAPLAYSNTDLIIADLGWHETELTQALDFLFHVTLLPSRPKLLALVPRMTGQSRPDWAELGVALALDRTTPPPDIATAVLKILQLPTSRSD